MKSQKTSLDESLIKIRKQFDKIHLNSNDKNFNRDLKRIELIGSIISLTHMLTTNQLTQLQNRVDKLINSNLPF